MSDDTSDNSIIDYDEVELDYSPESGSIGSEEKRFDETAPTSRDGRSSAHTKFYSEEGDVWERKTDPRFHTQQEWLNYAKKLNDGKGDRDQSSKRLADRIRSAKAYVSAVDLSTYQRNRTLHLIREVDDARIGIDSETLILSLITLVANESDRRIRSEQQFKDLRDDLGIYPSHINSVRERLRGEVL